MTDEDKAWVKNTSTLDSRSVTAKLVTPDELKRIWMTPEATGMTDDHQADLRIVTLADGSAFATKLSEIHQ